MLLEEYKVGTGKKPQHISTYILNMTCRGRGDGGKPVTGCSEPRQLEDGGKPAQTSSHPVLQPRSAGHRPACQTGGTKQAKAWDGGCGGCISVCNMNVCMYLKFVYK